MTSDRTNIQESRCNNERGSALLLALAILALLSMAAMMAVRQADTDVDLSFNSVHHDQAFYIAEAGARHAVANLNANTAWRAGFSGQSFEDGEYSVVLKDSTVDASLGDTVIVTSTGHRDGSRVLVELALVPDVFNPFGYSMFGDEDVEFKNSALTDSYSSDSGGYAATVIWDHGDVGSNGTISTKNKADIGGDISTSSPGDLALNAGTNIAGDTTSTAPPQDLPPVPASEFAAAAAANNNLSGISGSYSYDPSTHAFTSTGPVVLQSGTYYFTDVVLKNSAELILAPGADVKIYVEGDIEVKNSAAINDGGAPADLQIYSSGDVVLKNSGDVYAAFYSPDGDADLRNSGDFYGSIIANTIVVHNKAGFHYDRDLGRITRSGTGEYRTVGWRTI